MATPERPDRLYRLLGVTDQSLPAEEIHRVYRSAESRLRQQYLSAYRILSNPESKRIYDLFGERMVEFLDHPAWSPVVATLGSTGVAWTYAIGLLLWVLLMALFFIFLALKVDGPLGGFSWVEVFSPLIALLIGGILAAGVFFVIVCLTPTYHGIVGAGLNAIVVSMWFVCVILSATQLDRNRGNRWTLIFITLMIADLLRNAEWCWWRYPSKVRKALSPPVAVASVGKDGGAGDAPSATMPPPLGLRLSMLSAAFLTITIVDTAAAIFGWIVLGLKLDGDLRWTWYVIAIPFTVRCGLQVVWVWVYFEFARSMGQETGCVEGIVTVRQFFFSSAAIVTVYLVAAFLEGGSAAYPLGFALIPLFVAGTVLFLCAAVTGTFVVVRNRQMMELECEEIRRHAKLPPWSARSQHEPLDSFGASPRKGEGGATHDVGGVPFESVQRETVDGVEMAMRQHRMAHVFHLSESEVSEDTEVEPVERFVREPAPSESQLSDLSIYRRGYP